MTTLRTPRALADAGLVAPERLPALEAVAARYAVAVTPALAELIDAADPGDPIGLQLLPQGAELDVQPVERADPIGDDAHSPVAGIVHRYPDRALLKVTHTCAVYCRFCFRRETVGPAGAGALSPAELDAALAYIAGRPEIWEVILTGGDPLILSPRRLREVVRTLGTIEHVKIIRVHTRVPVAAPERKKISRATPRCRSVLARCGQRRGHHVESRWSPGDKSRRQQKGRREAGLLNDRDALSRSRPPP